MNVLQIKELMRKDASFGSIMAEIFRPGRRMFYQPHMDELKDSHEEFSAMVVEPEVRTDDVNIIGSEVFEGIHAPAIDIDSFVSVVPSRTPGHFHLFFDKMLTTEQYETLLAAMLEVGLVEEGYFNSFKKRGQTFVRIPNANTQPTPFKSPDAAVF